MKLCRECGAELPDSAEYCAACGHVQPESDIPDLFAVHTPPEAAEESPSETPPPAAEPAGMPFDPFAEASAQEAVLRAQYRAKREAPKRTPETPEAVEDDQSPAEPPKKPLTKRQRVLRMTGLAAAGIVLVAGAWYIAKGMRGQTPEPRADSAVPNGGGYEDPSGYDSAHTEAVCYFSGDQPCYDIPGRSVYRLGDPIPVSDRAWFAEHTRLSAYGDRIFFPTKLSDDPAVGYLLNYIDFTQAGEGLHTDITNGVPIRSHYELLDGNGRSLAYDRFQPSGASALDLWSEEHGKTTVAASVRQFWVPYDGSGTVCYLAEDDSVLALYSAEFQDGLFAQCLVYGIEECTVPAHAGKMIYFVKRDPAERDYGNYAQAPGFYAMRYNEYSDTDVQYSLLCRWEDAAASEGFSYHVYGGGACHYVLPGGEEWYYFNPDTFTESAAWSDTADWSDLPGEDRWEITYHPEQPIVLLHRGGLERSVTLMIDHRAAHAVVQGGDDRRPLTAVRFANDGDSTVVGTVSADRDENAEALFACAPGEFNNADVELQPLPCGYMDGVLLTAEGTEPLVLTAETSESGDVIPYQPVTVSFNGAAILRHVPMQSIYYDNESGRVVCISDYDPDTGLGNLVLIRCSGTEAELQTIAVRVNAYDMMPYSGRMYYTAVQDDGVIALSGLYIFLGIPEQIGAADYFVPAQPTLRSYRAD